VDCPTVYFLLPTILILFPLLHFNVLGWQSCVKTSFRELCPPRLPIGQESRNSPFSTTTSRVHSHRVWKLGQVWDHWAWRKTTFAVLFRGLQTYSGPTLRLPMFIATTLRVAFPTRSATGDRSRRPSFTTTTLLVAFRLAFATRASPILLPMIPTLPQSSPTFKSLRTACLMSSVCAALNVFD